MSILVSGFTVFFDANVLYPAPLRDFLMWLALTDLFRAKWSYRVHEEWMGALLRARPDLTRAQLDRTRSLMDANVRDCLVEDFEDLIEAVVLPDPGDRHVLAAAIKGRADVIVTQNLKHFPTRALARFGIEAQHPDVFVAHLLDLHPAAVAGAARQQRRLLKNPPRTLEEYLGTLEQQGLTQTVARLRGFLCIAGLSQLAKEKRPVRMGLV